MIYVIGGILLVTSFLLGFLLQGLCLWIDRTNNYERPKASVLIPFLLKMWYWRYKIYLLSLFKRKEKIYVKEMKKVLTPGLLERNFFDALMEERKTKNIRHIIEVVFHSMEKNRRKKLLNQKFKFRNFFFIKNLYIEYGYGKGYNMVYYIELFVLYNRYLRGEYMGAVEAEKAAKLFGVFEEQQVAIFEQSFVQEKKFLKHQWIEMKKNARVRKGFE